MANPESKCRVYRIVSYFGVMIGISGGEALVYTVGIDLNIEAKFFRGKGMDFESGLRWGASQQFQEKRIGLRQGRELERESEAYIVPA